MTSKPVTSPPRRMATMEWQRLLQSKKNVWASRKSVALRTFYRQSLSLVSSSFPFWKFRPLLARELLVDFLYLYLYLYINHRERPRVTHLRCQVCARTSLLPTVLSLTSISVLLMPDSWHADVGSKPILEEPWVLWLGSVMCLFCLRFLPGERSVKQWSNCASLFSICWSGGVFGLWASIAMT